MLRRHAPRAVFAAFLSLLFCACGQAAETTPTVVVTAALPTTRPTTTPQSTPTLSPATPPPLRESAVTPTPIAYLVEPGDTLIPIANKFGVSVADIIAANGGLDPASLQIGQRLIIPSGASNPGASNSGQQLLLPTPTPLPFEIRGQNFIRTAAGSLECLGEIFNATAGAVTNVQVLVTLQDESGAALQVQTVAVARDVVGPGESSPWRVLFTSPPERFAKFTVTPLRAEPTSADVFARIKIDKLTGTPNGSQFRVTGEAQNIDEAGVRSLRLIVTAYDQDKRVIGYRYVDAAQQTLEPQATTPFDFSIVTASRSIATFALTAEGLK